MSGYMSDVVGLYLRELIDWESYFQWRKGPGVDVDAEREALASVIETAAQVCEEAEPDTRQGWEEEVRLEADGTIGLPSHITNTYDKLREAGLISFGVREEYGGFELPSFVANLILQMIARADAGLMTMIGLQAGVAEDIQEYADEELRQR